MIPPHIHYVPTLGIRPSEMNAVEYSLGATKDNLKPCIILAPWFNSYDLGKSITRFEKAYPKRDYFLDIDRVYSLENLDKPIVHEMKGLLDPANGYKNWIDFIKAHKNIHPCIQYEGLNTNQIKQQIRAVKALNRPYCLRISIENIARNINNIIPAFENETNYTIILEGGWVEDVLTLVVNFSSIISNQLNTLNQNIPIVISCTSFPKEFSSISGVQQTIFNNRNLVNQLNINNPNNKIIYGDWGSTRPRQQDNAFFNRPLSRIDYPVKNSWYIARNKTASWDYHIAAKEIIKNPAWLGNLGIWGEDMIKRTAQKQSLGIDTPIKNVASRINIHLHRQAFHSTNDTDLTNIDLEEDFVD